MSVLGFVILLVSFEAFQVSGKSVSCPKCDLNGCFGSTHCDVHSHSCIINQHGNSLETRCAPDNDCHAQDKQSCCKTEYCIQRTMSHFAQTRSHLRCPTCTNHGCNPNTMCSNELPYCAFSKENHYIESWCDSFVECNKHGYTCCQDQACVDHYVKNHPGHLVPCPVCNDASRDCGSHFAFCHDACLMSNSSGRIRTHCGHKAECSHPSVLQCCTDPTCTLNTIYPTLFPSMGYATFSTKATTTSAPATTTKTTTTQKTTTTPITTTTTPILTTITSPTTTATPIAKCYQCGHLQSNTPCDLEHVYLGNVTECHHGKSYCQTDIHFDTTGSSQIYKRCVDLDTCRRLWLNFTAHSHGCMQIHSMSVTREHKCHFCCTGDGCNSNVIPDNSTLYVE